MGLKNFFSRSVDGNAAVKENDSNTVKETPSFNPPRRPQVTAGRMFFPSQSRTKLPNALRATQPMGSAGIALAREKEALSLLSSTPLSIQELRARKEQVSKENGRNSSLDYKRIDISKLDSFVSPEKALLDNTPINTKPVKEISQEQIAKRAWEIWQRNGCQEGQDLQNWTQAEKELREEL